MAPQLTNNKIMKCTKNTKIISANCWWGFYEIEIIKNIGISKYRRLAHFSVMIPRTVRGNGLMQQSFNQDNNTDIVILCQRITVRIKQGMSLNKVWVWHSGDTPIESTPPGQSQCLHFTKHVSPHYIKLIIYYSKKLRVQNICAYKYKLTS